MLMALLYCDDDRIAAAAPACDQAPYGDQYWKEIHAGEIVTGAMFETAYVTIQNRELRAKMMKIGLDDEVCGSQLAKDLISSLIPAYVEREERAA